MKKIFTMMLLLFSIALFSQDVVLNYEKVLVSNDDGYSAKIYKTDHQITVDEDLTTVRFVAVEMDILFHIVESTVKLISTFDGGEILYFQAIDDQYNAIYDFYFNEKENTIAWGKLGSETTFKLYN